MEVRIARVEVNIRVGKTPAELMAHVLQSDAFHKRFIRTKGCFGSSFSLENPEMKTSAQKQYSTNSDCRSSEETQKKDIRLHCFCDENLPPPLPRRFCFRSLSHFHCSFTVLPSDKCCKFKE